MRNPLWNLDIGASPDRDDGTTFRVWAPKAQQVAVVIAGGKMGSPISLEKEGNGFFSGRVAEVVAGDRYRFLLDDRGPYPDPASRFQPEGVHGVSQVVDPFNYTWHDEGWNGIPLEEHIIYELHVGTFSRAGTFGAVIPQLDYLLELGITAVELMPVAQCPGARNWGYDGVFPFAPQNSYGGPSELKELVDACHGKGLAVILDVIYNHLGPEGNYLNHFGHYFTDQYKTPWGVALNFDGPYSDPVREYFLGNALYWLNEFHFDGLRLDAVDWIFDLSAHHFLAELAATVHRERVAMARKIYLFAENDTNDVRLLRPPELGGYGLDAQWCDNFHHALRTLLTRETTGYYADFGRFDQMVKAYQEGYVYTGEYSPCRKKRHGSSPKDRPTSQFVVFSQNHDQVGNRKCGDRLSANQPLEKLLLAAAVVLFSPYLPLLFMGEEYAEKTPFHYFVNHADPALIEAVRKGKEREHASGICDGDPPDPEEEVTFFESKIDPEARKEGEHVLVYDFYRLLIEMRKSLPALRVYDRDRILVTPYPEQKCFTVFRQGEENSLLCIFSFSNLREELSLSLAAGDTLEKILDSSAQRWRGTGEIAPPRLQASDLQAGPVTVNPFSVLVYSSG